MTLPAAKSRRPRRFLVLALAVIALMAGTWFVYSRGPRLRWHVSPPDITDFLSDTPKIRDHVTAGGITAKAYAWQSGRRIILQVRPDLPRNTHQWEVSASDQASDWENVDKQGGYARGPIVGRGGGFAHQDKAPQGNLCVSFPSGAQSAGLYTRLSCSLRQFETYDEPVTFHNVTVRRNKDDSDPNATAYYLSVPHRVTVTTPSGIAVSLPTQGQEEPTSMYGLTCLVATSPKIQPEGGMHTILDSDTLKVQQEENRTFDLPHSPLTQAFGKPVQLRLVVPPPYTLGPWTDGPEVGQFGLELDLPWKPTRAWQVVPVGDIALVPPPPVLKNFTVIVRQRVNIQTIPMTFTVPVSNAPPPDGK